MNIKLYFGSEQADFNEVFNVMFSIGDVRELGFGNSNKTYTLNIPLTKTNKRLLSFISRPDVKTETDKKGYLYLDELLIIKGAIQITGGSDQYIKIIINSDDWIETIKNKKLSDLDLSAYDHSFTAANVENSWSAVYPFYRYPLINFGALTSGETGPTANWLPNDFIPMFSVTQLMTEILKPYTISSTFLSLSAIKDLFILAKESISVNDFINNKGLNASITVDDLDSYLLLANTSGSDTNIWNPIENFVVTLDEAGKMGAGSTYFIPETGTYRFKFTILTKCIRTPTVAITWTRTDIIVRIVSSTRGTLKEFTATYGDSTIGGLTTILDTGYMHFTKDEEITTYLSLYFEATNNSLTTDCTVQYGIDSATLELIWTNVNKYSGLLKNIEAEAILPNMSQLDFLSAIRDIYNLRFWMDKFRQVIYIEPWDQFLTSTVIDLTNYIDFENKEPELISNYYSKITSLKWKDDTSDYAYNEYLKTGVSPGTKDITMTSIYSKPGIETKEHLFSSIITGNNAVIASYINTPKIHKEEVVPGLTVFDRLVNFNTRLVKWDGMTAGLSWYYGGVLKNTYPKVEGLLWSDIYSGYLMKFYHYIDKGKLFTIRMKVKPGMLTQFFTVVTTATSEGFRPVYKITIENNDHYFFLQKITSDGNTCELELILKT